MVSTRASANSTASASNSETATSETDHNNSNKDVKNNNDKKKKTMESKKKSIKLTTTTTTRPAQRKDAEQMLLEATRCRNKKPPAAASNLKKPPPLASNDEPLFPLPSTLLPRCVRVYGWSKSFAKRAVAAYTRFLQVQKLHPGLVPPPVIDSVWQQHVLDTSSYQSWCRTFFRKVLHYNPEQLSGRATSQAKVQILASLHATRKIVANHYTLDDEIWSIPTSATTTTNKKKRKPQDDYNNSDNSDDDDSTSSSSSSNTDSDAPPRKRRRVDSKPAASSSPARQPLTIFVRWGQNPDPHRSSDLYFKIRPDTKMQRVFDRYTLYWNDATANNNNANNQQQDFCFFFGSKMVKSTDTAASLGLVTDDMIYATRCSAVEMEDDDDDDMPSATVPVMRRTTWSP